MSLQRAHTKPDNEREKDVDVSVRCSGLGVVMLRWFVAQGITVLASVVVNWLQQS